jgi:biofilm PGA synthesis N-glycosyltransferase PgaC
MSTLFVWWYVQDPSLALTYTFFFIPGVLLAFFGIFWIAGPLTLVLLPMALVLNYVMYRIGRSMFAAQGLRVRKNPVGFLLYAFAYSLILQPASVAGHFSEFLGLRKTWGSK